MCKAALNVKHVIDPIVNVVYLGRSRGLNHRQFQALLEKLDTEHSDVLSHSRVQWLSLGKVLRVWVLRKEIMMFLEIKDIQCDFSVNIVDEEWRSDFKFAIDIMKMMNKLNVKLQCNGVFAHKKYMHVKAFQMKLSLFSRQAGDNKFCHFSWLKEANISSILLAKYKVQLDALVVKFDKRFQDFKNLETQFNILSSPFTAEVDSAPEDILLDLHANNDLKGKFKSDLLSDFYKSLSDGLFPSLKNFATKFLSLFGSTCICEQAFSYLKINKSKNRSSLTPTCMLL